MREFRPAREDDLPAAEEIYEEILREEEAGRVTIGWRRGIYPTGQTARDALERGDLYVLAEEGEVLGSAIINQKQVDSYREGHWREKAPAEQVLVLHTLTISPRAAGKGLGSAFVAFYEEEALRRGCPYLRMDTNAVNARARRLYARLGYEEIGVVPCTFQGLPDVQLVLLEKTLQR